MFSRLCLTFPSQGLKSCGGENNVMTPHYQKRGGDYLCRRLSVGCPSCATLPTGRRRYELYVSERVLVDLLITSPPPRRGEAPGLWHTPIYIYIYIYICINILGPLALPVRAHCCDRAFRCTRSVPPTFQATLSSMWLPFAFFGCQDSRRGWGWGWGGASFIQYQNSKIDRGSGRILSFEFCEVSSFIVIYIDVHDFSELWFS